MAWSCHYATGCFVAFLGDISLLKAGWNLKKSFCFPALELFHCLPLWKTVLFVSSRAFSLSTPTFLLSTPVDNSEATWKKATKCNKLFCGMYGFTAKLSVPRFDYHAFFNKISFFRLKTSKDWLPCIYHALMVKPRLQKSSLSMGQIYTALESNIK